MFRFLRIVLAALTLFASHSPAFANYIYNPADLPSGFECDEEDSPEKCEQDRHFQAWWAVYKEKYDIWYFRLQYDLDIFFGGNPRPLEEPEMGSADFVLTPNIVDAFYSVELRHYGGGWAFAVQKLCDTDMKRVQRCRTVLRMISPRPSSEISPEDRHTVDALYPTNPEEVARELSITANWREADLGQCAGAVEHLLSFPGYGEKLWTAQDVRDIRGIPKTLSKDAESDEIVITADGDGVFLRASGSDGRIVVYSEANGGEAYDWAKEMAVIVEPCLKPSAALPPWQAILNAEAKRGSQ